MLTSKRYRLSAVSASKPRPPRDGHSGQRGGLGRRRAELPLNVDFGVAQVADQIAPGVELHARIAVCLWHFLPVVVANEAIEHVVPSKQTETIFCFRSKLMSRRLSTCFLFSALFMWPPAGRGQETNSHVVQRTIPNAPSPQAGDSSDIPSGTTSPVSVREMSIPKGARELFYKGIGRLAKDDPAGGLIHLARAVSQFPDYFEAYYGIGVAQMELGQYEEAQRAFQKSIDTSGGHYASPYFGLSALLCALQNFSEAEPVIRRGLELFPSFAQGEFTLAWALFGLNRVDEAEKYALQALQRDPLFAPTHLMLANIYIRRSDYVPAVRELEAYLQLQPAGAMSEQARGTEASLKRKLTNSILSAAVPESKP